MITVYGKANCKYCDMAKELLAVNGYPFEYKDVNLSEEDLAFIVESGYTTLPQCFKGNTYIGGYSHLEEYVTTLDGTN